MGVEEKVSFFLPFFIFCFSPAQQRQRAALFGRWLIALVARVVITRKSLPKTD